MTDELDLIKFLNALREQMRVTTNTQSVQKLYRHARMWTRIQCVWLKEINIEEQRELNKTIKVIRDARLKQLKGE